MNSWKSYVLKKKQIADDIASGNYATSNQLFEITTDREAPEEVRELAESMGLMSVKLEAREYSLSEANQQLKTSLLQRQEFGRIFIVVILFILTYVVLTTTMLKETFFIKGSPFLTSYIFTLVVLFLGTGLILYAIIKSPQPLTRFGLTLKKPLATIWYSLLWCIPAILLCTIFKWILVATHPAFSGRPIIEVDLNIWYLVYIPGVFAQEFIARCGMQSTLVRLLTDKNSAGIAILLTALTFSAMHFHHSVAFGIVNFFAALYWGWLFHRQNSLLGVGINHYIVGTWFFGFLGLEAWTMGMN